MLVGETGNGRTQARCEDAGTTSTPRLTGSLGRVADLSAVTFLVAGSLLVVRGIMGLTAVAGTAAWVHWGAQESFLFFDSAWPSIRITALLLSLGCTTIVLAARDPVRHQRSRIQPPAAGCALLGAVVLASDPFLWQQSSLSTEGTFLSPVGMAAMILILLGLGVRAVGAASPRLWDRIVLGGALLLTMAAFGHAWYTGARQYFGGPDPCASFTVEVGAYPLAVALASLGLGLGLSASTRSRSSSRELAAPFAYLLGAAFFSVGVYTGGAAFVWQPNVPAVLGGLLLAGSLAAFLWNSIESAAHQ